MATSSSARQGGRRRRLKAVVLVPVLALAAGAFPPDVGAAEAQCPDGSSPTSETWSTTAHTTTTDVTGPTQTLETYRTRVTGMVKHWLVSDSTSDAAVGSAPVASAEAAARQAIQAFGVPWWAVVGPITVHASRTLQSTSTVVEATDEGHEDTITTQVAFGPTRILVGEELSQECFIPAGVTNTNTNTHRESFVTITTTTTETYRNFSHRHLGAGFGECKRRARDVFRTASGEPVFSGPRDCLAFFVPKYFGLGSTAFR